MAGRSISRSTTTSYTTDEEEVALGRLLLFLSRGVSSNGTKSSAKDLGSLQIGGSSPRNPAVKSCR